MHDDAVLVVWDILSHMVSVSLGRCLASCIRVHWPDLKILQGLNLQIHVDHSPNRRFNPGQNNVQECERVFLRMFIFSGYLYIVGKLNFFYRFSSLKICRLITKLLMWTSL